VLAVALAVALAGTPAPRLAHPHACPEAFGFTCSTLRVPLDHSGRTRGTLSLAVATEDGAARRPFLLLLTGGPGQPGVPFAARLSQRIAHGSYRLVLIDQRGTGAGALRCPELQTEMGSSDLTVPTVRAVTACASALGARRRFFTTWDTVDDIDLLRRALGARRLALDGISYGTFVAERYAVGYPGHVDRLVLDSVVPHARVDPFYRAGLQAVARVLRDACKASQCGSDPAADLAAVVRKRHDGTKVLDALVATSIIDPSFTGVPDALHAARGGDASELDTYLERVARAQATTAELLSQGLHAATLCGDLPAGWQSARPRAAADVWPFDLATATGNGIVVTCAHWPAARGRARPVPRDLPRVPVLLLAGDHDLSTPLAWARAEAARAPRGRLVVVHGAGHSVQSRALSDEGRAAVAAFLG
jgi:pimeloyl-ACP methyl ester carboxylesterase